MGSRYKKRFEREWKGKCLADIKIKTLQKQADKNITGLVKGKFGRKLKRYGMLWEC